MTKNFEELKRWLRKINLMPAEEARKEMKFKNIDVPKEDVPMYGEVDLVIRDICDSAF